VIAKKVKGRGSRYMLKGMFLRARLTTLDQRRWGCYGEGLSVRSGGEDDNGNSRFGEHLGYEDRYMRSKRV
jgi:hypothetical protein